MRLIAHRGFAAEHPENTIGAVGAAARVADGIEVDARRCGSGELVVVHDERVDRVTDGTGRVEDLSLPELQSLDVLESGAFVPTLAAVVSAVPEGVEVNVDCKESGIATDVAAVLVRADNDAVVSSVLPDCLREIESVPTAYIDGSSGMSPEASTPVETARDLGCVALHPEYESCLDTDLVERAHGAGLEVNAWTVETRAVAESLYRAGVDGIIADRARAVGSTGRRSESHPGSDDERAPRGSGTSDPGGFRWS